MKKTTLITLLMFFSGISYAENAWYDGKISRIMTSGPDGSFIIYIDNADIKNTCRNEKILFHAGKMGEGRTKAALSMALSAFLSGMEYGVVVDLPEVGGNCTASETSGAGARISSDQ